MILLLKRDQIDPNDRVLGHACSWSKYAPILDRVKQVVPSTLRDFHTYRLAGRDQPRITLTPDGQMRAIFVALIAGQPVAREVDVPTTPPPILPLYDTQLYKRSELDLTPFRHVSGHPGFGSQRGSIPNQRVSADSIRRHLDTPVVVQPGDAVLSIEQPRLLRTHVEESQRLDEGWFEVYNPSQAMLEYMMRFQDSGFHQFDVVGRHKVPNGLLVYSDDIGVFSLIGGRVDGAVRRALLSEEMSDPMATAKSLYDTRVSLSMSDLPALFRCRYGHATTTYHHLAVSENGDRFHTKSGSTVQGLGDIVYASSWDILLDETGVTAQRNLPTEPHPLSYEVPAPISVPGGSTREALLIMGMSEKSLDAMSVDEQYDLLIYGMEARNGVPAPENNFEALLQAARSLQTGVPYVEGKYAHYQPFWDSEWSIYTPVESEMSKIFKQTKGVQQVLRTVVARIQAMNVRVQDVIGRASYASLAECASKGWGIIGLESLEKVLWLVDGDLHLPHTYDQQSDMMKKALVVRLLLGENFGSVKTRGVQPFSWMDTHPDENYRQNLGRELTWSMFHGTSIFRNVMECPEYGTKKTLDDYGEEMIQLLVNGRMVLRHLHGSLRGYFQMTGAFRELTVKQGLILSRGGIFGKWITLPQHIDYFETDEFRAAKTLASSSEKVKARAIGAALVRDPKLQWNVMTNYSVGGRERTDGLGYEPRVIFDRRSFTNSDNLGIAFLKDEVLRSVLYTADSSKRILQHVCRTLDIHSPGRTFSELLAWPPVARPNIPQTKFMSYLKKILKMSDVSMKERLRTRGLDKNITLSVFVRLVQNNPALLAPQLLLAVLVRAVGRESEDLEAAQIAYDQGDYDTLHHIIRTLGTGAVRRKIKDADEEPQDMLEALVLGGMSVGGMGLFDED